MSVENKIKFNCFKAICKYFEESNDKGNKKNGIMTAFTIYLRDLIIVKCVLRSISKD